MSHWVFRIPAPKGTRGLARFIGTRKNTGRMYMSRVSTTPFLAEARVFNTAQASSNAGNRVDPRGEATEVSVGLLP